MWNTRALTRTRSHWSALGALIILTLLAYEPFLQTIITQYGVLGRGYLSTQALTGQSRRLDSGRVSFGVKGVKNLQWNVSGTVVENCSQWYQPVSQPEFGMPASVYNGFQNSLQMRKINASASCPTGNCTFGNFVSLGVCSKCADISRHITKHSTEYPPQHYDETTDIDNMCSDDIWTTDASGRAAARFYNYTVFRVGNLNISNHNGIRNVGGKKICQLNDTSTYLATAASKNISQSFHAVNTSTTTSFVLFQGLRASDSYIQNREAWQDSQPTAFECELSFCAKVYSSQYENGQFIEHVLGEWAQPIAESYKPLNCPQDKRSQDSQFAESSTASLGTRADFQFVMPEVEIKKYVTTPNIKWDVPEAVWEITGITATPKFNVSQATIVSTVDWFQNTFGHKMIYPATGVRASVGIAEILNNSSSVEGRRTSHEGVSAVFAAVANSMSIWIRDRQLSRKDIQPLDRPPRVGMVRRWTTLFGVRWPFLALPLALEVAGTLYVFFTIRETRRLGVAAWKDSALATIVYGLGGETNRALLKDADAQGNMEYVARQMRVRLVKKSNSYKTDLELDDLVEGHDLPFSGHDEKK
ncbi:hypothetical protein PG990_002157 [Apiospora arundinis]